MTKPIVAVEFVASGNTVYVVGDFFSWLNAQKARDAKSGGYIIRGRRAVARPIALSQVRTLARLFPHGAAAKALAEATA